MSKHILDVSPSFLSIIKINQINKFPVSLHEFRISGKQFCKILASGRHHKELSFTCCELMISKDTNLSNGMSRSSLEKLVFTYCKIPGCSPKALVKLYKALIPILATSEDLKQSLKILNISNFSNLNADVKSIQVRVSSVAAKCDFHNLIIDPR
ncbi:unnamed protein product [Moneuplotes crassus]|uniref:Uncharacterized protein n=1 Tax=Euplotes crassus TaxID=5936 RepID=A0AAD1URX8_EUPCR|nr:unnamed protein product [Moneuplotes crassus]